MNIMVTDDTRLVREGIVNLLKVHGYDVVSEASDGAEAIAKAEEHRPDLILMDIRMPRMNGVEATRIIKARYPKIKVVMLTVSEEEPDLLAAIESGADGYLLKNMTAEQLCDEIKTVQEDQAVISKAVAAKLLEGFRRSSIQNGKEIDKSVDPLTARETEILKLVSQGLSNRDVGENLFISENTVKYHMKKILEKLHMEKRAQVIAWASRRNN